MVIIASIVMMTVDHHFNHLSQVRKTISAVMYPIEYLAGVPSKIYHWGSESFSARNKLLRDNAGLRAEQIRLELQLQKLATLEQENTRLREMLSSAKYFEKERILISELLSVDLDPYQPRRKRHYWANRKSWPIQFCCTVSVRSEPCITRCYRA